MRLPSAPYHEHAVIAEVKVICREHDLECRQDAFGNLYVSLRSARERPLVLAAHMDHPGFHLVRKLAPGRWLAEFRGSVGDPYFVRGLPVRLVPGAIPARLGRRRGEGKRFELRAGRAVAGRPEFAVWELEDFAVRGGRIHGRGCDDVVGCAAVLATLIELTRRRAKVNVIGVLSRAEEVGFHGALALAAARELPRQALVISLETSRELPGVKMGRGVILRVGDRASTFDSGATRFLAEVAGAMKAGGKPFAFQRALMSGGTCEATAYQEFGYQSAAVCVALGNYHNCGARNRIRAEYVSLRDVEGMVGLLVAAAEQMPRFGELAGKLPVRLNRLLKAARAGFKRAPVRD